MSAEPPTELTEKIAAIIYKWEILETDNLEQLKYSDLSNTVKDILRRLANEAIAAMGDESIRKDEAQIKSDALDDGLVPSPAQTSEISYNANTEENRKLLTKIMADGGLTPEEITDAADWAIAKDIGSSEEFASVMILTEAAARYAESIRATEQDKCLDCGANMIEVCSGLESICGREPKPVSVSLAKCTRALYEHKPHERVSASGHDYEMVPWEHAKDNSYMEDYKAEAKAVLDAAGVAYVD